MTRLVAPLKKGAGHLLSAAAVFLLVFLGSQALYRIFWVIGHPEEVAEGPPGVLMAALVRLVLTAIASATLLSLGRRLADPGRLDRRVRELAVEIARGAEDRAAEPIILDRVSSLYGALPLADLVLIHDALDRQRHPARHMAVVDAIRQRVAQGRIRLPFPQDGG